jgi:membrane protein YdbS with pleckstrin-like domain
MYCGKCGTENTDDAVYCKKCGGLIEPEDETQVAGRKDQGERIRDKGDWGKAKGERLKDKVAEFADPFSGGKIDRADGDVDDDLEERIFSITPTIKFVMVGYLLAVLAAFALVALISIFIPSVGPVPAVVVGLALLLIPAFYHIRKKLIRYTLTETMIQIDRGLISRTTKNIPLRRVQDVTVTASVAQRILGYGDIELDNASDNQERIILDDIDSPKRYAELILRQMRHIDR